MSRRQVKVDRRVKRVRAKVVHKQAHKERVFARRWLLEPEPGRPFRVELRVARTRHLMRTELLRLHGTKVEPECRGGCKSFRAQVRSQAQGDPRPAGGCHAPERQGYPGRWRQHHRP